MGLIAKVLDFYLAAKYKKAANKMVKSDEFQKALKDLESGTNELNKITEKLKPLVIEKKRLVQQLKNDGIDVTMASSTEEIMNKIREKHKDILNKYNIK